MTSLGNCDNISSPNQLKKGKRKPSLVNYLSKMLSPNLKSNKEINDELAEYIISHTGLDRSKVVSYYQKFLKSHPSGFMDLPSFRCMLQESRPNSDKTRLAEHIW